MDREPIATLTPPKEANQDWQPGTKFWQIFTGHQTVYTSENVGNFFQYGKLHLPPSELRFFGLRKKIDNEGNILSDIELQNPILVQPGKKGFHPQEVLHQSWLGVQDGLRMYVFDEEGLKALKETLTSSNITFTTLPGDLGVTVETKIPAIIKDENTEEIKQDEVVGLVFFLNEKNLQTPADALALADQIAKLHPETAKNLMSSLLTQTRIVSYNLQVWKDVLTAYETGQLSELPPLSQLPQPLQDIFTQIKSYLEAIPSDLATFEQGLAQKLGTTPLSNINLERYSLPIIDEDKVKKHLKRILNIASKEEQDPKRLQRLLQRLERNINQTPPIVNEAYKSIDPKKWLLTEVAERGRELMLDRMAPSDGMILEIIYTFDDDLSINNETFRGWAYLNYTKYKKINSPNPDPEVIDKIQQEIDQLRPKIIELWNQRHPDKPIPKNVREWIKAMGIKKEITQARQSLIEVENLALTHEQQEQYQKYYQQIEKKIREIMSEETADKQQKKLSPRDFPPHPVLARWAEIESIINDLPEGPAKDKIKAVFDAKKQLAKIQKEYTDLFLERTIKYMPGGYYGWNERLKGVLNSLLETSPHFASLFKEPNCAGRMILLSGMLMEAQVFEENDLVTMSIYNHAFLGGFDALGIGRVIEGSGEPICSYFGPEKEKVFQGKVFDNQEVTFQTPLNTGLLTQAGMNYLIYLESEKAKELQLYLLQQSEYINDILWNNLAITLKLKSLDFLFSQSRAASINNFYPTPFYHLLHTEFFYNKDKTSLQEKQDSPLLPFIKLNLLVMKKSLEDGSNTQELKTRIKKEILRGFTESTFQKIRYNLEALLSLLAGTEIPDYWKKKYGANLENATIEQMRKDLWNPDLFPKPVRINKDGSVFWEYPS